MGVSKPPDMSRITEAGSEPRESPRNSPLLSSLRLPTAPLDMRPTSMHATKARDSLSLTWSGTPIASSSSSRRGRPSGLMSLDPMAQLRSSPPPSSTSLNDEPLETAINRPVRNLTEFDPILSPLTIPPESLPSTIASRGKDREKTRRKPVDWDPNPQATSEARLNDMTNSSPTSTRKALKPAPREEAADAPTPEAILPPPTPIVERRSKKLQAGTPSLAEDLMKHGG